MNAVVKNAFRKRRGISLLAERLSVSQEGPCFLETGCQVGRPRTATCFGTGRKMPWSRDRKCSTWPRSRDFRLTTIFHIRVLVAFLICLCTQFYVADCCLLSLCCFATDSQAKISPSTAATSLLLVLKLYKWRVFFADTLPHVISGRCVKW